MAVIDHFQGSDIEIAIDLTDTEGSAIDIDDLDELYIWVVHTKTDTVAAKYSKAGGGEYEALRRVDAENYIADWYSSSTKDATPGLYDIEANMVEDNANFEDSEKNTVSGDTIIRLRKSRIKTESSGS